MADEFVDDGTIDWSLGMDSFHDPENIRPDQYYKGINVTSMGGYLSPRYGFHERPLTFENTQVKSKHIIAVRSIESIWLSGKFQAFIGYFQKPEHYIVTVISGLIYKTNIRTWKTVLMSQDIKVNQYVSRVNWSYAKDKIELFDYPDYNVIIDGDTVRRADPKKQETPISTNGAYNQNRLFITNNGAEFTAGDPVGSLAAPDAPITFKEVLTSGSPFFGQFFASATGEALYPFTAIGFIQNVDANTGIGSLFLGTENKVLYYHSEQPRDSWSGGQPFGGVLLNNVGIVGPRSFCNVNSDLFFMAPEGHVYVLSTARNDAKKWGNLPISREVEKYIIQRDKSLFKFSVLGYFDNRVFITVNPYRVRVQDRFLRPVTDYAHAGFVVINLENMATFLTQGTPVWDGLWTGVNPMDMCTADSRCFIMAKDGGSNKIYELSAFESYDTIAGKRRTIESVIYTKEYNFGSPYVQKQEYSIATHFKDISGDFSFNVEKKPSQAHQFVEYADWDYNSLTEECAMPKDKILNGLSKFNPGQIVFGDAKDERACNPITKDIYKFYLACQFRLRIRGLFWRLKHFKIRCTPWTAKELQDDCSVLESEQLPLQCEPDWLIPECSNCDSI